MYVSDEPSYTKAQLNLLQSCIFYEDRELFQNLNLHPFRDTYNMDAQIKKRPLLTDVLETLKKIAQKHDLNKFELNCQIPGLNIIGITGYKKTIYKAVHIELLDEFTTLKNTNNVPTGFMQLKLRLLEKCDEALIVVGKIVNKVIAQVGGISMINLCADIPIQNFFIFI